MLDRQSVMQFSSNYQKLSNNASLTTLQIILTMTRKCTSQFSKLRRYTYATYSWSSYVLFIRVSGHSKNKNILVKMQNQKGDHRTNCPAGTGRTDISRDRHSTTDPAYADRWPHQQEYRKKYWDINLILTLQALGRQELSSKSFSIWALCGCTEGFLQTSPAVLMHSTSSSFLKNLAIVLFDGGFS